MSNDSDAVHDDNAHTALLRALFANVMVDVSAGSQATRQRAHKPAAESSNFWTQFDNARGHRGVKRNGQKSNKSRQK